MGKKERTRLGLEKWHTWCTYRAENVRASSTSPIVGTGKRVIGVLHLENKTGPRAEEGFDEQDEARLQYLAQQVALAVEKVGLYEVAERWEREGIEDDLHELINWYHSGVVLWLETMQEWYGRGRVEKAMDMLPALLRQARTTLFELKTIHTTVSIRELEAEGMESALHRMASAWAKRASFPVSVNVEVNLRDALPPHIHNILLRIAVGAIGNAIVHSGGHRCTKVQVWVRLGQDGDQIVLEVEDNGRGIEPPLQEGYGISRMRQLARQLQSDLEIDSKRGKGTKVSIRVSPWS